MPRRRARAQRAPPALTRPRVGRIGRDGRRGRGGDGAGGGLSALRQRRAGRVRRGIRAALVRGVAQGRGAHRGAQGRRREQGASAVVHDGSREVYAVTVFSAERGTRNRR